MAGAGIVHPGGAGPKASRRNLRSRLACARCQRRKIRCDGNRPVCNNCKKASAACTDGDSIRIGDSAREQIDRLRQRVAWLESIIKERCPDVDLSQNAPTVHTSPNAEEGVSMSLDGTTVNEQDSLMVSSTPPMRPRDSSAVQQDTSSAQDEHAHNPSKEPATHRPNQPQHVTNTRSHEIGLLSLNGSQDPRYIGPSSGYFLARVMLSSRKQGDSWRAKLSNPVPHSSTIELVEALQGPMPLPPYSQAVILCEQYFETINPQYPILHRPTFMQKLHIVLENPQPDAEDAFQVFMVFALGSVVASHRRHLRLPAESYCLSALRYFDRLNIDNSLQGLQCLLLLFVFTLHCPHMRLSLWHLNYQCLAATVDLGLQRKVTTRSGISLLEQEMRTRIFWVVLTLDRKVATMMGRPIGLRDEACELRLPENIDDEALASLPPSTSNTPLSMSFSFAIHLCALTKLNSEIKYIANSVAPASLGYAYPSNINLIDWQREMSEKLDQWIHELPPQDDKNAYLHSICEMSCQSLKMVLLRPSPAIPHPSRECLQQCHAAADRCLRLIGDMYRSNLLVYSWETLHILIGSVITKLYIIKMVPDVARDMDPVMLVASLGEYLSILSAVGEHWPSGKRCRDFLHDMGQEVISGLKTQSARGDETVAHHQTEASLPRMTPRRQGVGALENWNGLISNNMPSPSAQPQIPAGLDDPMVLEPQQDGFDVLGAFPWTTTMATGLETDDMDAFIRSLFDDFIPYNGDSLFRPVNE
ncbi:fungal-specific transcription factor domain-containing protein [Stachybotrys elegans]|uniref:Fungal-specific transcription factor domain-containing protein n=1 Tax=Stachybotrys elegans TaxID=80388 RepID=A0A8K0SBP7_9HYPO|nr:fungal-specific transcription factor domain-containing protein [Stachybotrys elegans]